MTAAKAARDAALSVLEAPADAGKIGLAADARVARMKQPLRQRGRTGKAGGFEESKVKRVRAGRTGGGQFATKSQQEKLRSEGLYQGKIDGIAGPQTEAAVKAFQAKYGLKQTGKLDERTRATLENPPPKTAADLDREDAAIRREEAEKGKSGSRKTGTSRAGSSGTSRTGRASATGRREGGAAGLAAGEPLREGMGMATKRDGEPRRKRGDGRVRTLQKLLQDLGYDLGEAGIDGRFGPQTSKAVKALQRDWGLKADGVVGNRTGKLLDLLRTADRSRQGGLSVDEERLSEAARAAAEAALLVMEAKDVQDPTQPEREALRARFPKWARGVSLKRDKDGLFVHTHRARSKSFPSVAAIPESVVRFIESTG